MPKDDSAGFVPDMGPAYMLERNVKHDIEGITIPWCGIYKCDLTLHPKLKKTPKLRGQHMAYRTTLWD